MSLSRGKYGIEYSAHQSDQNESSGIGLVILTIIVIATVALSVTIYRRNRAEPPSDPVETVVQPPPPSVSPPAPVAVATPQSDATPAASATDNDTPPPPPPVVDNAADRPHKLRSLLMRLEKAEENRDVAMAASTIEMIRALPGRSAADIDDKLARRLGELNFELLFGRGGWNVREVRVKPGDSATRIANENGMTLAMFKRLNSGVNIERLIAGAKVKVISHPNFLLEVHGRAKIADLYLGGRFFKRYDLMADVTGAAKRQEANGNFRQLITENGIVLSATDRAEIEMLVPRKAVLMISDL